MAMLKIQGLYKHYNNDQNSIEALKDCNLEIYAGECVAIRGSKASGKTTLLRLLGGLERATSGSIFLNHKDITSYSDDELAIMRRNEIGFLYQNGRLIKELTIHENIMLPSMLAHKRYDEAYYREMTKKLNISDVLSRYPSHLSERQLHSVVYARALINQPNIILADEAVYQQLDKNTMDFLLNLVYIYHKTLIMVNDDTEINIYADHIIELKQGAVVEDRRT